jgi:hypothetical protein
LKTIRKSLVLICLWKLAVVWTFWNNRIDMLSVSNICIRYETDPKNLPIANFFYPFLKFVQINYIFSYNMHILYVSYNHILDHSYIMNMWTLQLTRTKLLYKKTVHIYIYVIKYTRRATGLTFIRWAQNKTDWKAKTLNFLRSKKAKRPKHDILNLSRLPM